MKVSRTDSVLLVGMAVLALVFFSAAVARSDEADSFLGDDVPANPVARSPMLFAEFDVQGVMSEYPILSIAVIVIAGLIIMSYSKNLKAAWAALRSGDVKAAVDDVRQIGAAILSPGPTSSAGQLFEDAANATQTLMQVAVRSGSSELLEAVSAVVPEIQKLKKAAAAMLLLLCCVLSGCSKQASGDAPDAPSFIGADGVKYSFGHEEPTAEERQFMAGSPIENLSQLAPEIVPEPAP